ncbi:MAG TPA: hypothetical protein VFY49_07090 [Myxococcota bacterium]|nr:hypothetical protein [Myxococcota bacterium]
MWIHTQTVLLALLAACPVAAGDGAAIPGDVTHVAAGRSRFDGRWSDFRLVITGICSPEHCFSSGRIEWVDGSIPGKSAVIKTAPVEELESVLVVRSIAFHPMQASQPASFEIDAVNTYTAQVGRITLTITGVGSYEAAFSGDPLNAPPDPAPPPDR